MTRFTAQGLMSNVTSATLCAQNATYAFLVATAASLPSYALLGHEPILVESLGVVGNLSVPVTSANSSRGSHD